MEAPYYQAARFPDKKHAGSAYTQAQEVLRREVDCDLSTYRFVTQAGWHVLVIGEKPEDRIHLEQAFSNFLLLPSWLLFRDIGYAVGRASKVLLPFPQSVHSS